jgi:hypothetical protein
LHADKPALASLAWLILAIIVIASVAALPRAAGSGTTLLAIASS